MKTVKIKNDIWKGLIDLKYNKEFKSINEVIAWLLYNEVQRTPQQEVHYKAIHVPSQILPIK